jgi:prevent-host-death family protein
MAMAKRRERAAVGAAEFKARCLELVDHVRETAAEYTVTRHGVPVATLGPVPRTRSSAFVGSMTGSVLAFDRPLDPISGAWMSNEDEQEQETDTD